MRARNRARRMVLRSGLPEDAVTGSARTTMSGRSSVLIEGQRGVVEMSGTRIRLKTRDGVLNICGRNLKLEELSLDAAMVHGEDVHTITYGNC